MDDKYIVLEVENARKVIIPFIDELKIYDYMGIQPFSYKCNIIKDPFGINFINVTISIYTGTRSFPRRASQKYESDLYIMSFYIKNDDSIENQTDGWNYILFLQKLTFEQLKQIDYSAIKKIETNEDTSDIIDKFGGYFAL